MKIIVYEDQPEKFSPLINLYPQYRLRIGGWTILDNILHYFPKTRPEFLTRDGFENPVLPKHGPVMYLSSRLILKERINLPSEEVRFVIDDEPVGFLKTNAPYPQTLRDLEKDIRHSKKTRQVSGSVLNNLCDLIRHNNDQIVAYFRLFHRKSRPPRNLTIIGSTKEVYVTPDAVVHDLTVVDVTAGPVFIDRKAVIRPLTTIAGPAYIGPGSVLDRAKVTHSAIGPHCRIGGEVEACVFQGYSNKYHEGFLGHSFVGEWVNLGALATNSDLKNNYGPVRIKVGREVIDSGLTKLGVMIGDHAKLGIGTLIPTGTVIGSFVNFFGGGMTPRFIPSFKWLGPGIDEIYDLDKAIETARVVMKRRQVEMTPSYENRIRAFYKHEKTVSKT